jgi:two-component sensor histidine kinase
MRVNVNGGHAPNVLAPTAQGRRMMSDKSMGDGPSTPFEVTAGSLIARCENCWIVEEADHRIANHLAMLAGFVQQKASALSRQHDKPDLQQVQFVLQSVRLQIGLTGRLHRTLSNARRTCAVDLADHLREICNSLLALAPNRVELVEDLQTGCLVGAMKILPLSCMVAEVLTNSVKYAASPDRIGRIRVGCRPTSDGGVLIAISDDGPGLPAGLDPSRHGGFGFQLLRALGKQLGAPAVFESSAEGLRFEITLPSEPDRPA